MLSQLINTAKQDTVHIDSIRLDGGTQPRQGIDDVYVTELAESMVDGAKLPPVDVMYDGANYWLFDGYHRVAAHRKAGFLVVDATIHQGTQADAQWRSYAANQTHGLRRTNDDKQRAIKAALRHPNGATLADREIARHLGVDHKTVGTWREKLQATGEIPQSNQRTGADGRSINTTNIGTNQPTETDEERRQRIRDNDRRMKDEINSRYASETPAARTYWAPASAPIPAGWNQADEAEYQALLPTWQQSANQFHAISELDRITLRRVAERLSVERLDNLRFSLQERRRTLWLEERRQERDASAISNQQSPISNPAPVTETLPPADAPLPTWADEAVPAKPSYDRRRLTAEEACTALLGQAIVDAYTVAGVLRITLDNNQLVTISSPSGGIMYAIEEA